MNDIDILLAALDDTVDSLMSDGHEPYTPVADALERLRNRIAYERQAAAARGEPT